MAFSLRLSFSLTLDHVDQSLDPDRVFHSLAEWFSVLSWVSVSHWKLINYLQYLLGHRVPGPIPEYISASTCRFYLDITSLVPEQNTLEAYRGPSHMIGALPWHQPAWSLTKNPRRLLGALGYLLGSYSVLVNWLGNHSLRMDLAATLTLTILTIEDCFSAIVYVAFSFPIY